MGLSGKYDFQGIKKLNAAGMKLLLAASPYSAWILKGGKLTDLILEFIGNLLANFGLVLLNLGANWANGEFDQHKFDKALSDGLEELKFGKDRVTPAHGKEIDDAVITAANKFISFNTP